MLLAAGIKCRTVDDLDMATDVVIDCICLVYLYMFSLPCCMMYILYVLF